MTTTIRLEGLTVEHSRAGSSFNGVAYPRLLNSDVEEPILYPQMLTYPSAPKFEDIDAEGNGPSRNVRASWSNQLPAIKASNSIEELHEEKVAELLPRNDDERNESFAKMWSNHWREYISILPGLTLLFGNFVFLAGPYSIYFFIAGNIIGVVIGGALISILNKRFLYCIAAVTMFAAACDEIIEGISFAHDVPRFLYGISVGLGNFTVIIRACDITSRQMRNFALKSIILVIALCAVISNCLHYEQYGKISAMFFAPISIILSLLPNESTLFLLERGQSDKALAILAEYNSESTPSDKTKKLYESLKSTVESDKLKSNNIFSAENVRPLLMVCGVRLLSVLLTGSLIFIIYSPPFSSALDNYLNLKTVSINQNLYLLILFRLTIGSIYELFISRYTKPNFMYYGLATFCGILLILSAILGRVTVWHIDISLIAFVLYIMIDSVISFSFDLRQNVQIAKIPRNKRAWSMVIAGGLEYALSAMFTTLSSSMEERVILMTGICLVGVSIMMIKYNKRSSIFP